MDNSLSHLADEDVRETLQYFRGRAKIDICHIRLEEDDVLGSRPADIKDRNVTRLVKAYNTVGCWRLEPENHVLVTIDETALYRAVERSKTTQQALLSSLEPPYLTLEANTCVLCLKGKSRLRAAGEFFPPGERWWTVQLYLDTLPSRYMAQLREKHSSAQKFNYGDIYRNLRWYQLQGNTNQCDKWWLRLESNERQYVKRLQMKKQLLQALDSLLPYIGLWASVRVKLFKRILDSRCYDECVHYISQIQLQWSLFLSRDVVVLVDAQSVSLLEGLMPSYSLRDQSRITELMNAGRIFPTVRNGKDRAEILEMLLKVPGRILTLYTLSQDLIYLELPVKKLRCLLPRNFQGTVREAMIKNYRASPGATREDKSGLWRIQTSAGEYKDVSVESNSQALAAHVAYIQLWLFSLRYFAIPRVDAGETPAEANSMIQMRAEAQLAAVARELGFHSNAIDQLCLQDTDMTICRSILKHISDNEYYELEAQVFNKGASGLHHTLKTIQNFFNQKRQHSKSKPMFSDDEDHLDRRYNRPEASDSRKDRQYLFIEDIYSQDQAPAQSPTSLAVTREVVFSFLGKHQIYELFIKMSKTPSRNDDSSNEFTLDISNSISSENVQSLNAERQHDQAQSSTISNERTDELDYEPSSPVHMSCHPPGNPDLSMQSEETPPLAPGFEDYSSAPVNKRTAISVHRKAVDMLKIWYSSACESLIILFLFNSRSFYKFREHDELELRSTINMLAKDHYFLRIDNNRIQSVEDQELISEVKNRRLLLVGAKDAPGAETTDDGDHRMGEISFSELTNYMSKYDVTTGKRIATESEERPSKRAYRGGIESSDEEL